MRFFSGLKGRSGRRFNYQNNNEEIDSTKPITTVNYDSSSEKKQESVTNLLLDKPQEVTPIENSFEQRALGQETTLAEVKKDKVEQKNVSINFNSPKGDSISLPSDSTNESNNKQYQSQNQGSTTPKTNNVTKNTSKKSNHQKEKKSTTNCNTPSAIIKTERAKQKSLRKVKEKLAKIKAKIPKK